MALAVVAAAVTAGAVTASPVFVEVLPADATLTTNETVILTGTVTGASALDLNGTAVVLRGSRFATLPFILHDGTNTFVLTAVDGQGGSTQMTRRIERHSAPHSPTMDPMMPAAVDGKSGTLLAQYGYRGAHALQTRTVGGLTTQTTFDAARRPVHIHTGAPNAPPVLSERIGWDPRGLKSAIQRDDLGGAGHLMAYDGAHRLVASARVGQPLTLVGPNTLADVTSVTGQPNHEAFAYDSAMNQTNRLVSERGVVTPHPTPNDGSGRNRPASVNGVPLIWDDSGNLRQKGDMVMSYDFRNRLTTVERGGEVVVEYTYDALNRRVAREASGVTETYAWDGNQEIETTRDGVLTSHRVYGANIDETVMVSRDTNGDGSIDSSYLTMFDSSNNLAVVTTLAGKPIERYETSAFGERRILVDSMPPTVEQVRFVADALWLEISESVVGTELQDALAGGTLRLRDIAADEDLALAVEQPVTGGGQALRRIVITPNTAPVAGTSLELIIEPGVLVDSFANTPSSTSTLPVTWPGADAVITDTAPPRVGAALVRDGIVELELSEEVDPASAAITVDGAAVAWTLSGDHYTLVADQPLGIGSHTLAVDTAPLDLAGSGLAESFEVTFTVAAQDSRVAYRAPDERETAVSTLGNDIGFHGRPVDEATGLMYFRNRWFDPELGRFTTPDPLGYMDGPSMYQFAGYSPANYGDPLGLFVDSTGAYLVGSKVLEATAASAAAGGAATLGYALGSGVASYAGTRFLSKRIRIGGRSIDDWIQSGMLSLLVSGEVLASASGAMEGNPYAPRSGDLVGDQVMPVFNGDGTVARFLPSKKISPVASTMDWSFYDWWDRQSVDFGPGSAPDINPGFEEDEERRVNCMNCVIATDSTFAGRPASALPGNNNYQLSHLERIYGRRFMTISGKEGAIDDVGWYGPGARAIIYGHRGGRIAGHVFNAVVNKRGEVKFWDGQSGDRPHWKGYVSYKILITNPR